MEQLIIILVLLVVGFTSGTIIEKQHLKRLKVQEDQLADIITTNMKHIPAELVKSDSFLVMGSVCIATDYFKVFLAGLRNLFGGEMKTFETLMIRARREATVRMLTKARELGANSVWNVRLETMTIAGKNKPAGIEIVVYGTAVK